MEAADIRVEESHVKVEDEEKITTLPFIKGQIYKKEQNKIGQLRFELG